MRGIAARSKRSLGWSLFILKHEAEQKTAFLQDINNICTQVPGGGIVIESGVCCCWLSDRNSRQLSENGLAQLFQNLPRKCLVLLEDVDSWCGGTGGPGRVLIMTTNHLDRLDSALIRPGCVDCQPLCINKNKSPERGSVFPDKIPENTSSPADIQGFLLKNKTSPEDAVAHVELRVQGRLEEIKAQTLEPTHSNIDQGGASDDADDGATDPSGGERSINSKAAI
ncbi:hypothetical protein P175DRAFT_0561321 [Aspergillus ochraceoroseus IBT 24754]|uniref:Mitochondrial chaperone BCS1-like ATPase lid domain-containing protein n=1 Tax=Aspergillus ochraceoroseus IBT 24754 TaxID=1392256 RepID=A0A2T5LKV0_9EURO|nr:uncharacterized protein P175DRAFT_0561321 [Aspergillus ochraceoroseus IBT 24754]PTU16899.1 hypothetical protein P175DRAFT_0561321 [Aspergillus ochraceoroseus IBT 24754]